MQSKVPAFEKKIHKEKWFSCDEQFNQLYPPSIQVLAKRHWTPLGIARKVAGFLAEEDDTRILDIGSGVGKFCLSAAYYKPHAFYYGVEQREKLISHAEIANEMLNHENVSFIHGNFTQLDFRNYDHFYFYNSFYENLTDSDRIDDTIDYSGELYNYYSRYLRQQLETKPAGTKLVTFHSFQDEVPKSYKEVDVDMDVPLTFWIKM
jgi:hypothetical protein